MAKRPGTMAATRRSSSTIRSNRVINSWTNLLRKSFRALATWTIRRCSLQDQPATVAAAEHAPCDLPLKDTQLSKNPAIPAGVFFLLPIAERGQSHEPEIDADRFPSLRQRFGLLDRAGESDEPLPRSAEDTGRLDRSFKPAIPANGDPADAKKIEATAIDLEAIAVFLEAESRKAVPDLEPGIAGILTGLDPAKERLERFVQARPRRSEGCGYGCPARRGWSLSPP